MDKLLTNNCVTIVLFTCVIMCPNIFRCFIIIMYFNSLGWEILCNGNGKSLGFFLFPVRCAYIDLLESQYDGSNTANFDSYKVHMQLMQAEAARKQSNFPVALKILKSTRKVGWKFDTGNIMWRSWRFQKDIYIYIFSLIIFLFVVITCCIYNITNLLKI